METINPEIVPLALSVKLGSTAVATLLEIVFTAAVAETLTVVAVCAKTEKNPRQAIAASKRTFGFIITDIE